MNRVNIRSREGAQAPLWCISKHIDIIAVMTLAAETGHLEWQSPGPCRRRLVFRFAHLWSVQ
jgi:hypothetical protein